jgi:hypothetical protein
MSSSLILEKLKNLKLHRTLKITLNTYSQLYRDGITWIDFENTNDLARNTGIYLYITRIYGGYLYQLYNASIFLGHWYVEYSEAINDPVEESP